MTLRHPLSGLALGSALFVGFAASANAQQLVDIIHHHETTQNPGPSYFGHGIARVGDLMADGTDDFIVGCPGYETPEEFNIGKAFLWFTGAGTNVQGQEYVGSFNAGLGATVCALGDVDGDGIPDAAIGRNSGQEVWIVSGGTGAVMRVIASPDPNDFYFGFTLAGPNDMNQDGHSDLLVGSPWGGPNFGGAVYGFDGMTGAMLFDIPSDTSSELFGASLCRFKDFDGDARPDFLVGAPWSQASRGYVQIRSGEDGSVLATVFGDNPAEFFGTAIAAGGDANEDGQIDFLVSAPGSPAGGDVRMYSASKKQTQLLGTIAGGAGANVYVLEWLPDMDEDGASDWAAGSIDRFAVFSGSRTGVPGGVLYDVAGIDGLGFAMASMGDISGDHRPDLVVSAPNNDDLYIYSLVPAGETLVGTGTTGCHHCHRFISSGVPQVGNATFELRASNGTPMVVGLGMAADAMDEGGHGFFGFPTISYLDLDAATEVYTFDLATDAVGYAAAAVPIPNDPALAGKTYVAQAFFAWVDGCSPGEGMKLSSSNALVIVVQP